ncbi:hypothetical protein [Clostridium algidicarnis]|uniref:hypothetical protein n=1 Tax=Clostridium algidicarnis TaxID=37659 RepID=UPI003FD7285D
MFEYTFTTEKELLTPFCTDFKQIKNKLISQTPECIHRVSEYPNGFVLEIIQYNNKIIFKTNKELIDNNDGTLSVKL